MPKYIVSAENFEGKLVLDFNPDGFLMSVDDQTSMSKPQREFLAKNYPSTETKLNQLLIRSNTLIAEVSEHDLSFDSFWCSYDYKIDKKAAERAWKSLNKADKIEVLDSIPRYNYYLQCKTNQDKIYPARYIKYERFKVDYKSLLKR